MKLILYVRDEAVLGMTSPKDIDGILRNRAPSMLRFINSTLGQYIADYRINPVEGEKEAPRCLSDKSVKKLLSLLGRELEARVARKIGSLNQLELSKVKRMKKGKFAVKARRK
jgi:hypothetical protein